MQADEFARRLLALRPSVEQLRSEGLTDQEAETLRESFLAARRRGERRYRDNPLLDLVESYDVSGVEVGMVSFGKEVEDTGTGWLVGSVEADNLLVDRKKGHVVVREFNQENLLWRCAVDASSFLDAILAIGTFLEASGRDESLSEDDTSRKVVAGQCARMAGGDEYSDFYKMLLGV